MTDLQSLDPPEWCNTSPERQTDPALCEQYYFYAPHNGELYQCAAVTQDGVQKCLSAALPYVCANAPSASPPPATMCPGLASLTDVQSLSPPEWCNTSPERRTDPAACAQHYYLEGNDVYMCEHDGDQGKCVSAAEPYQCETLPRPPAPPPVPCDALATRTNAQTLDPPEWCNTNPERQTDPALCEQYYYTVNGELYLCEHDGAGQMCVSAAEPYFCGPSIASYIP